MALPAPCRGKGEAQSLADSACGFGRMRMDGRKADGALLMDITGGFCCQAPEPVLHWDAVPVLCGCTRAAWALHALLLLELHCAALLKQQHLLRAYTGGAGA